MQIDFWQYSQGSVERIVTLIADRVLAGGERLLVVDGNAERRASTSAALWGTRPECFLANGDAAAAHAERQPVLLSDECEAINGAKVAVLADGEWRDPPAGLDRVILLFSEAQVQPARAVWRQYDGREDVTRGYFAQDDGKWTKRL